MHPIRPRNSRRGFTLVEVLVCIAIIGILAATSIPTISYALQKARTAKCVSNLRSIGMGLTTYASDNNGNFPEAGGTIPYNTVDSTTHLNGWTQQIEPYITAKSPVYQCPDSSRTIPNNATYSYFIGGHAAYQQTHAFGAVNMAKIQNASEHILAGDISFGGFTPDDADKDDYTQDPAFNGNSGTIPIHGGYSNILFVDGHVQSLKAFDKTSMCTRYDGPGYDYLQ